MTTFSGQKEFFQFINDSYEKHGRPAFQNLIHVIETNDLYEFAYYVEFFVDLFLNTGFANTTREEILDVDKILEYLEGYIVMYLLDHKPRYEDIIQTMNRIYQMYKDIKKMCENENLVLNEVSLKWRPPGYIEEVEEKQPGRRFNFNVNR